MVIKVQISLSKGPKKVLLYNEDKSVVWEGLASKDLRRLMCGRSKAFFHASIDKNGLVQINEEADEQDW